jgi:insertion element IS1 protein InsB
VTQKGNKKWVWLALDESTHEIVGVCIGTRDEAAALQLWASLPAVYRQCAIAYTDFWAAYAAVSPRKGHQAIGKETGQDRYIEAASFSARLQNVVLFQIGRKSYWGYLVFIHHHNESFLV